MRTPVKKTPDNTIVLEDIKEAMKKGAILATEYSGVLTLLASDKDHDYWWFTKLSEPLYVHSRTKGWDAFLARLIPDSAGVSKVILFDNAAEMAQYILDKGLKL